MNSTQNDPLDDDDDDDVNDATFVQPSPEKSETVDSLNVVSFETDENVHPSPLNPE